MESTPRAHKPKSIVWKYYQSDVDSNGRPLMRCCFCTYSSYSSKNATKLRLHLIRRCPHISEDDKHIIINESEDHFKYFSAEEFKIKSESKPKKPLSESTLGDDDELDIKEELIYKSSSQPESSKLKNLEEENTKLSSRLELCLKQNEALLQITKHLDESLELMQKLDSISNRYSMDGREDKVKLLKKQLKESTDSAKEWKQKLRSIEYNDKYEQLFTKSAESPTTNHKPLSSIWKYYKCVDKRSSEGFKEIKCIFCSKIFRHKNLNSVKCRTHIVENCENCPQDIKDKENVWYESQPKSKIDVWQYFYITDDEKWSAQCMYCGATYSGKNATRSREHLVFKCEAIPDDIRQNIRDKCDDNFLNNAQQSAKTKSSDIWKHFEITENEGKTSCRCVYCGQIYGHKNATKFRQHLVNKCVGIPGDVRSDIGIQSSESLRTWTQTKIPVWTHFEVLEEDGKQICRCIYCDFTYAKNATKCRLHLMFKCKGISIDKREKVRNECKNSFLSAIQKKNSPKVKTKVLRKERKERNPELRKGGRHKSKVWEHYSQENDSDGNPIRRCNYCEILFSVGTSKNATKMRDHLALVCKTVPEDIKQTMQELNDGFVRPYRKKIRIDDSLECCWPGCEMIFNKRSTLQKHQLIHTGVIRRIKCDWPGCEWSGRDKTSFKIHKCVHTGEKPWICDWPNCDFKTSKPSSLYVHKLRHKNLLRFKCEWPGCERTFLTTSQRKVHTMVHLGLKPFGCQFCDRRYPQLNKLKVHQNKHHSNQKL